MSQLLAYASDSRQGLWGTLNFLGNQSGTINQFGSWGALTIGINFVSDIFQLTFTFVTINCCCY
jgi:hypothetical protein